MLLVVRGGTTGPNLGRPLLPNRNALEISKLIRPQTFNSRSALRANLRKSKLELSLDLVWVCLLGRPSNYL